MVRVGQGADPVGGGGEQDPVSGLAGADRQPDREVGLAGAGSDGERLQHLRSVLPCSVRVTASTHPLFGELLAASGFKRWNGVLLLVVALPDRSPGTIRADATDVFAAEPVEPTRMVLDGEGLQVLRVLVAALQRPRSTAAAGDGKGSTCPSFAPTTSGR